MSNSYTSEPKPSGTGAFLKGALSGAFNGALMSLVAVPIGIGLGIITVPFLSAMASTGLFMVLVSSTFSGIISAKRAMFDTPTEHYSLPSRETVVPVPIHGLAHTPMIAQSLDTVPNALAAEQTQSWAAKTGRNSTQQSNIESILANGSLSDKDRASAILAAREAASADLAR